MSTGHNGRQTGKDVLQAMASPIEPVTSRFKGPRVSEAWEEVLREVVSHVRNQTADTGQAGGAQPPGRSPGARVLLLGEGSREKALLAASITSDLEQELYRVDLGQFLDQQGLTNQADLQRLLDAADESGCALLLEGVDDESGLAAGDERAQPPSMQAIASLMHSLRSHPGLILLALPRQTDEIDQAVSSEMDFVLPVSSPGRGWNHA
jgi:hypothetical protein